MYWLPHVVGDCNKQRGPQFHVVRWNFYELFAGISCNDNFLFNGIKLFKFIIMTSF